VWYLSSYNKLKVDPHHGIQFLGLECFTQQAYHIAGVWLDGTTPHPRHLLGDDAKFDAFLGVKCALLVSAPYNHILSLGKPAQAAGVVTQLTIFTNLQHNILINILNKKSHFAA
jgi:hypothetical protein